MSLEVHIDDEGRESLAYAGKPARSSACGFAIHVDCNGETVARYGLDEFNYALRAARRRALSKRAIEACQAWQAALEAHYGNEAGAARYDARGTATGELARLYAAKVAAHDAWRAA